MKYPIKTERLIIRLAEPEDAESIFSYRSDFAENKYQGWFPDSVEEVRDYISNMPATMDIANICFQFTKLLQKSEMRKNMVMDLIYRGFIYAANYSESHYNPRRSQIKTELRYLFVTTPNRWRNGHE